MKHESSREENDAEAGSGGREGTMEKRIRARQPRLGSFVTIAVAVLMLFGAASRMGKMPETAALFGIDRQAESRIRQEEERLRTAITIGAVPVSAADLRPHPGALPIEYGVLPPARAEVDPDLARAGDSRADSGQRTSVSLAVPENFWRQEGENGQGADPAPPGRQPAAALSAAVPAGQTGAAESYVVANGDTWVKIAKRTLGDSKRWEEIKQANPAAADGLRVGMRLVIPK